MPQWAQILSGWLYLAFIIGMLLLVLLRRRSAQSALGWSLAIILLPGFGAPHDLVFRNAGPHGDDHGHRDQGDRCQAGKNQKGEKQRVSTREHGCRFFRGSLP